MPWPSRYFRPMMVSATGLPALAAAAILSVEGGTLRPTCGAAGDGAAALGSAGAGVAAGEAGLTSGAGGALAVGAGTALGAAGAGRITVRGVMVPEADGEVCGARAALR